MTSLFDVLDQEKRGSRDYSSSLTADVNQKGVLDVDTVKGCTAGMAARPGVGCYDGCYAAKIAKFRGINFSKSVARKVYTVAQARSIERAVQSAPDGFFRVGTMGDPSHEWEHTTSVVEWLSAFAVPVIVTKHWLTLSDGQIARLVRCGSVLNTSVSALDTPAQLRHRLDQLQRYKDMGGISVARVVSCDFNLENSMGYAMNEVQKTLFALDPIIDNPLRISMSHPLVVDQIVKAKLYLDLGVDPVTISKANPDSYTGNCAGCADKCGLAFLKDNHPRNVSTQISLF